MTFKFAFTLSGFILGSLISSAAMAQDYGLTIGVHQTTATVPNSGSSLPSGSVSGRLNYDLGLTASFELLPNWRFRSGILYNTRGFDFKPSNASVGTTKFNFSYVDVPVNVQYNFNQTVGLYGGLIVGVKASDSVDVPNGASYSPEMKSLYPLLNVGANFMFNDMIGFDVYYENGLGDFSKDVTNYQTFGLHFIYWL